MDKDSFMMIFSEISAINFQEIMKLLDTVIGPF